MRVHDLTAIQQRKVACAWSLWYVVGSFICTWCRFRIQQILLIVARFTWVILHLLLHFGHGFARGIQQGMFCMNFLHCRHFLDLKFQTLAYWWAAWNFLLTVFNVIFVSMNIYIYLHLVQKQTDRWTCRQESHIFCCIVCDGIIFKRVLLYQSL